MTRALFDLGMIVLLGLLMSALVVACVWFYQADRKYREADKIYQEMLRRTR